MGYNAIKGNAPPRAAEYETEERNMYYTEPEKRIPVYREVDVLVLGGGPAGVAAAVSAARAGAKTLLVEQQGDVGGVATTGLMSHWTGDTAGGIYEEILDRSMVPSDHSKRKHIVTERLKTVLLEMLFEAGAEVLLNTMAAAPIAEDGRVKGVIIENKSGRSAVFAKVTVDSTGDGDIAARAGAEYVLGRETDGKMQPVTLMFKVGGVDYERAVLPPSFESYIDLPKGEVQALGKAHLPFPAGHVLLYPNPLPGVVTVNMTNCIDVDGTDAESLVRGTRVCRSQLEPIADFLREYVPGFEEAYILESASVLGVRETRHFKGLYTLTEEDIRAARVFDDWAVTRASFNFDVHNLTGAGLDATGQQATFVPTGYTIPYRCLVPEKLGGLLLAGRNISGTHKAHSNYRVMPICANMGQAAGIAAALCAEAGIEPRELDVRRLQKILLKNGVLEP